MFCATCLFDWVFDLESETVRVGSPPLPLTRIETDTTALHFNGQVSQQRVSDHKIALAVLFVAEMVGSKPRARIENRVIVVQHVGEFVEDSNFRATSAVIPDRCWKFTGPKLSH